jgi:hypothetical protein
MSCGLRGKDLFFSCALPSQGFNPPYFYFIEKVLFFDQAFGKPLTPVL